MPFLGTRRLTLTTKVASSGTLKRARAAARADGTCCGNRLQSTPGGTSTMRARWAPARSASAAG